MRTLVGLALSALLFYFGWITLEPAAAEGDLLRVFMGSALIGAGAGILGSEIVDVFR